MKNLFLKRKIALLSVFAGLAYVWMLFSYFSGEWESAQLGYQRGYGVEGYENSYGLVKDSLLDVYNVPVSPRESVLHFPEKIKTSGYETVDGRFSNMKVALTEEEVEEADVGLMETFIWLLMFCAFVLFLLLPFRFFRLIGNFKRGDFFCPGNKSLMRQMGWMMIGLYVCDYLVNYLSWRINLRLFEFEDYVIVANTSDAFLLVVGIVALLLAEVFSKGASMEREQRLTI